MGSCVNTIYALSCVILCCGLVLYTPVHPDVAEPFKIRIMETTVKLTKLVGSVASLFGYHKWIVIRNFSEMASSFSAPLSEENQMTHAVINGVNVSIFEPKQKTQQARRGIIYIHGGSFAIGSATHYSSLCDALVSQLQAIVIFVDYRRLPEYPYPAAFMDCYNVTDYVLMNPEEFNIEKGNIGVIGDSAGGNLATAVALKLRKHNEVHVLKYQALVYPLLQGVTVDLPSYLLNDWYTNMCSRKSTAETVLMYIGEDLSLIDQVLNGTHISKDVWQQVKQKLDLELLPSTSIPSDFDREEYQNKDRTQKSAITDAGVKNLLDKYAFPLMADSLTDLPKSFVLTCALDTLRDEGMLYVQRLRKDNVKVVHKEYRDMVHGFLVLSTPPLNVGAYKQAVDDIVAFVQSV